MEVLRDILTVDHIKVGLSAGDMRSAVVELIDVLADEGLVTQPAAAIEAVLAREEFRSTCIAEGLALPHSKTSAVKRCVLAIGKPAEQTKLCRPDGQVVRLVALVLSPPADAATPIRLLAEITSLIGQEEVRDALYAAGSAEQIYQTIISHTVESPATRRG